MPAKAKETKESAKFVEFKFTGKKFEYTGRLFPKKAGKGKVVSKSGFSLDLNGLITIKGCQLVECEDKYFITWPHWTNKDKKDESYIYIQKELNEELDALAEVIYKKIYE